MDAKIDTTTHEKVVTQANKSLITSGGRFSNAFSRGAYQDKAVSVYLQNHKPSYGSGVYNSTGRAYPDVSAIADGIFGFDKSKLISVGETSFSAPIFASMITLINEERLAAGKGPVGFLNPTLYANPGAFNDVSRVRRSCAVEIFLANMLRR